nr:hypothetical protein [Tanacetum cinerariifolium]
RRWTLNAMLTVRERRFVQRTGRNLGANRPTSMGFNMSKVECYNCHRKGHFAKECRSHKDTRRNVAAEPQRRNVPVETSTSNALVSQCYNTQVFTSFMFDYDEMFTSETDESLPTSPIYVSVELSPTKPDKELSHRPSAPIIEDWVSDSKDDSEAQLPQNVPSFVHPTEQVKTPRPSVKHVENSIPAINHKTTIPKPKIHGNIRNRKACFVSVVTKSKLVPLTAARQVTTAVSPNNVTRPRPAKTIVTKPYSPPRRNINRSPSPKASTFPPKVIAAKAPMVNAVKGVQGNWGNPHHDLKDKGVIDSGCSRHMTGNLSYLSDFEENGRYVTFGGKPKGGKISGKGKIRTGKLDFDDVYFVKELNFNFFSVS